MIEGYSFESEEPRRGDAGESDTVDPKDVEFPYGMHYPHYTDRRFNGGPLTTFVSEGAEITQAFGTDKVDGLEYNYKDRLAQWDWTRHERAHEAAKAAVPKQNTPRFYEEYLRAFFDDPELELVHILAGVNRSSGHPYHAYGYRRSPVPEAEQAVG